MNPAQQLVTFGQSIWYDNISRDLLDNGEIQRLIDEWGVRGMTSNPTIFDGAISRSTVYDRSIRDLRAKQLSDPQIFEKLAVEDVGRAADLLLPLYRATDGDDGYVSIEVSPHLARDTAQSIEEARRLWKALARRNVMIKIPGTEQGIPAIHSLLVEGINVNITLLFSVENYIAVAQTYCEALRERLRRKQEIRSVRSVASFFVSRVDTSIDKQLTKIVDQPGGDPARQEEARALLGKFGIANSKIAYRAFQERFLGAQFEDLRQQGAAVQRPLWASTGTKNPAYRDVIYVEELIGPHTVNTMPHETLRAFVDHGRLRESLTEELADAEGVEPRLRTLGIDVPAALRELQVDGVKKFTDSFVSLMESIGKKD